jgi:hypothetical protein
MRKFVITAALVLAVATPALAQGMAAPAKPGDSMAGPMTNDTMKMDHKKKAKKAAMAHDAMGAMAAPASASMSGPSSNSMSGPGH